MLDFHDLMTFGIGIGRMATVSDVTAIQAMEMAEGCMKFVQYRSEPCLPFCCAATAATKMLQCPNPFPPIPVLCPGDSGKPHAVCLIVAHDRNAGLITQIM